MNLYYHLAFNPWNSAERGLMMPALGFLTKDDAGVLWQWLKAVATKPMPVYLPAAAKEP